VLINLGDEAPPFLASFARVAEIILNEPEAKNALRARWKLYRDAGHTLEHRPIPSMRGGGGG
jgi:DNA polymerase-3 subunit chi